MPASAIRFTDQEIGWQLAQLMMLAAGGAFVVALLLTPEIALKLFWYGVLPLLPISFLVTPIVWRSLCPLATLNVLASHRATGRRLSASPERWLGWPGMVALALLVPARLVWLNTSGAAFASVLLAAGALALLAGRRYESRAGFCNSLCPILPVERLYGLDPMVAIDSPRCRSCSGCTPRGCPDSAKQKVLPQLLSRARHSHAWLSSAFGLFATAFPGFIAGYFSVAAATAPSLLHVYLQVFLASAVSVLLAQSVIRLGGISAARAVPLLAGIAAATYYAGVAPSVFEAFALPDRWLRTVQLVLVGVVVLWTVRAYRRAPGVPANPDSAPVPR
jgi:nitrite reductase (NADH) large subunit